MTREIIPATEEEAKLIDDKIVAFNKSIMSPDMEENIIKKINIKGKIPQHKIHDQLKNGNIKIFSDNIDKINNIFLLKIAGIWETDMYYGLTYKFVKL